MSLFSALRRKPEEDDLYDEYEPNYAYEEDDQGWQDEGVQPIHSVARSADRPCGPSGV